MAEVEIGIGKTARRAYRLDEVAIVPSKRTRDPEDVDVSCEIDAYRFELPILGAPADSVSSPATAIEMGRLGAVGVLHLEGLWTRYEAPEALLDEIAEHARAEAPNECCGMVAARDGEAVAVHRATNTAASPFRYELDPMEQYRIQTDIEDAGCELGAIYHSHTRSRPEPSQTDINLAFYPEALYVIVGLKADEPDVRAWRIVDGQVSQARLEVVP